MGKKLPTFVLNHWGKLLILSLVLALIIWWAIAPAPEPKMDTTGLSIIKVQQLQNHPPAFQTRLINGVEYKVSRDEVGHFGGRLYSANTGPGPKTFNPLVSNDAGSSEIAGLLFASLLEMDPYTGLMVGHLAKDYKVLPDNKTYLVTLRKGLTWTDGHPITADDVVFTWNKIILAGLGNVSNRDTVLIDGQPPVITKVDDLTIKFATPVPFGPFVQSMGNPILPKHIIAPLIAKDVKNFDNLWGPSCNPKTIVGSGLFKLVDYESGQRARFVRNPNYFMVNNSGQKLPYVDEYIIEFVKDENAELLQFEQGRLDSIGVQSNQIYYVRHLQQPQFNLYDLGPTTSTTFMVFNLNTRKNKENGQYYVPDPMRHWFQDKNFRWAVNRTINRKAMIMNILMGAGQPLFTAEGLPSIYLNQKLAKGFDTDVVLAKQLLTESGFKLDNQGRLRDAQNNRVEFELATNSGNLQRESTAVAIKNDLAKLGIKVNIRVLDFNVLVGRIDTSEWQAIILGLTGSPIEPHGGVNVWRHDGALHLMNQRKPDNDMPGTDTIEPWEYQLDDLMNKGAKAVGFKNRKPYYDTMQQVIYDNALMLYLYSPTAITAVRTRVKNVKPTPLGVAHNLESWWVDDKETLE